MDAQTIKRAKSWLTKQHGKASKTALLVMLPLVIALVSCDSTTKTTENHEDKATVASGDNLYPVSVNGLEGYIDASGKIIIQPQFDYAGEFSEGLAFVNTTDNKRCLIDMAGNIISLPEQIDLAWPFHEGLAQFISEKKYGYIDKGGNIIVDPQFDFADPFSDGMARVTVDHKVGFIDKTGKMVITPQYEAANSFSEGLAPVKIDKKWGFIDKTGKPAIAPQYNQAYGFSEGLACVEVDGKRGFIDKTVKFVVSTQFDYANFFSEGLAAVRMGDWDHRKYGFIDQTGNCVIEPQFIEARGFCEGIALVKNGDDEWMYVDKTGKAIFRIQQHDVAFGFIGELAPVTSSERFRYINKKGEIVWTGDMPQFILSLF